MENLEDKKRAFFDTVRDMDLEAIKEKTRQLNEEKDFVSKKDDISGFERDLADASESVSPENKADLTKIAGELGIELNESDT